MEKDALQKRIFAASFGGIATAIITTPFDVVKTRMQASGSLGTVAAFQKVITATGIYGLWKGIFASIAISIPSATVYYVGYEIIRDAFSPTLSSSTPLVSGMVARIVTVSLVSPLELLRTRIQAGDQKLSQVTRGIFTMVRQRGPLALYSGLSTTLWRDVPFSGVYWSIYERLKQFPQSSSLFVNSFINGSISGMVSAAITHPFDVAKTLQQVSQEQLRLSNILVDIYKADGIKGFFVGLAPRMAKVMPACGIMISSFEIGKQMMGV